MIIRLCGRLVVEHDGEPLQDGLPGRQGRLLFAYLALAEGSGAGRDELIDAVWYRAPPADPNAGLSTLLSRLRAALPEGAIEGRRELSLSLRPGDRLDVKEAQAALGRARAAAARGDWTAAESEAREAIHVVRAPLMPGHEAPWLDDWRRRLEDLHLEALELCAQAGVSRGGDLAAAEAAAREVIEREPYRESGYLHLMEAQVARGNTAEALRVYEQLRVLLREELGTTPGAAAKALHEQLLRGETVDRRAAAETTPAPRRDKRQLPRALAFPAGSAFVGRDAELARLGELWIRVRGGARAAVFLAGEAGIGKTRLAGELAESVAREGGLVLHGRCDEDLAVPYQPFVEALRPHAGALGSDALGAELGRLAPELARLLPELEGLGKPLEADPETQRFALFEAVTGLLESATREQPALIVIDDLHWAARPTLLMLRHVIRSERRLAALVLGTYRQTEVDAGDPLAQLLADLRRDASAERLDLGGLDDEAVATFLRETAPLAQDQGAAELARMLRRQTAGNPFFLRELLAHLHETGVLSPDEGGLPPRLESGQLEVPAGLGQVIHQRVARLSEAARSALAVAAAAGPTFSLALVERVLGEEAGGLDALDESLSAGLLTDAGPGHYAFAHALVRKAIYGQLTSVRRMRLHRRVGQAIESLPDPEARVEALAHHFAEAAADGEAEKAVAYALAAGRSAAARLGYEEAVAHYERGLEVFGLPEHPGEETRCELLLALGEARWNVGDLEAARDACLQAAEVADSIGDAEQLARAALAFGGPPRFEVGAAVIEPVVRLLERALAALGEEESALRARVLGHLAAARSFSRRDERRPALARKALEMARRLGDRATLADVLAASNWATRGLDNLDDRLATARELAGLATELDDGKLAALAHSLLAADLLELGDVEGVERELTALEALAQALRQRYPKFLAVLGRARRAYLAGRLAECEQLAHEASALGLEGRDEYASAVVGAQIAVLRREQGRLGELVEGVERLAERYPELPSWRCGLAYAYAELDRRDDARRELEALAGADFSDLPRDGLWLTSMSHLSAVVAYLRDTRRAELLYEHLLPYADRCAVTLAVHCQGSVARSLGQLATTTSRFEEAGRHFEQALDMNARIRSPLWVAHTRHDYARMLLRRGDPADAERAVALLDDALATADELGLRALADRARPLRLDTEAAASA